MEEKLVQDSREIVVSVWMTAYNQGNYIAEAIEGVIMQKTGFRFELVIGEDYSTDATREICIKYRDMYPGIIVLLLHKRNMGLIENYKTTLEKCRGRFIAQCDGDDYWTDPFKLQKKVDFLESDLSFGMVFTDKDAREGETIYQSDRIRNFKDTSFYSILLYNMICSPSTLVRADIIKGAMKKISGEAVNRKWLTMDYPLWLEISYNYKIGYLPIVTCVYRVVGNSGSHPVSRQSALVWERCLLDIQLFYFNKYLFNNTNIPSGFINEFREMVFHKRKRMVLDYRSLAFSELLLILKMNPFFYYYLIRRKLERISAPKHSVTVLS